MRRSPHRRALSRTLLTVVLVDHCQNEHVAAGTHAIGLSLRPVEGPGPAVRVAAFAFADGAHRHSLLAGARAGGWTGDSVVVPLRHVVRHRLLASLCMTTVHGTAMTLLAGSPPGEPDGRAVRVVYLGAEHAAPAPHAEDESAALGGWPDVVVAVLAALVRGFTAP